MKTPTEINLQPLGGLNKERLSELSTHSAKPCLTLLMPTHSLPPERETDPLLFKNLLNELKSKMKQMEQSKFDYLLEPLEDLITNRDFWNHQQSGLAVFISPELFQTYQVPIRLPALTVASDSFHVKPLYKYLQQNDQFQVLVLNQDGVKLFEGNRFHLTEIDLEGKVPLSLKEALGSELTDNYINSLSGNLSSSNGNAKHGYMEKSQEQEIDASRFFRLIDEKINEHFSTPRGYPLILAALPEHHAMFRLHSKNERLQPNGIEMNAAQLSPDAIKDKAWAVLHAEQQKQIEALLEDQQLAASRNLSNQDPNKVMLDVLDGKVHTLFVEEDRQIKGRVLEDERRIDYSEDGVDDLLDDLSALVVDRGGSVIVLNKKQMPYESGVVSVNRF